jgi:hypothetical protein
VAFRAERRRLRDVLRPGEEILASDALAAIAERPELTVVSHPVLVVTTLGVYLTLEGKPPEVRRIDFESLGAVDSRDDAKLGVTLRLTMTDGEVLTCAYDRRRTLPVTAGLIVERFAGSGGATAG